MAVLIAALCTPAWSQGKFDAELLRNYGGRYSSACADPAGPSLTVAPDALVFGLRGRTITGRNVLSAYSYFGQSPPPDFQVALMSQVKGRVSMVFLVYQDASGQYIRLEGDPKLAAALSTALMHAKYRYCGAPRPAAVGAPAAAVQTPPQAANAPPAYGSDVFGTAQFKTLYKRSAGALLRVPWLSKLEGPSAPLATSTVGGHEFVVANSCKPHDCADHNVVFLYAASESLLYGKVYQNGKISLIGSPPPAVARELDRQWTAAFRRK